jgi:hypothetical protein
MIYEKNVISIHPFETNNKWVFVHIDKTTCVDCVKITKLTTWLEKNTCATLKE